MIETQEEDNTSFRHYSDFINARASAVHALTNTLEKRLYDIEKKSLDTIGMYRELDKTLSRLISVHESFNSIDELSYLHKIKALTNEHHSRIGMENVSFNIIHYLLDKINSDQINGISLKPSAGKKTSLKNAITGYSGEPHPFAWIGFERSGSNFIIPFRNAVKIAYRTAEYSPDSCGYSNSIIFRETRHEVIDPFVLSLNEPPADPAFYLIVENPGSTKCFAADKIIRRYLAPRDFITEKIRKFRVTSSFSKGFVKLEGIRYIVVTL